MPRSRSGSNSSTSSVNTGVQQQSNGGILGSGIFGHFGTFINCKAEDSSLYCNFVKVFNVIIILLFMAGIIFLIYYFFFKRK